MGDEEITLVGGRSTLGVMRIGDTVHRPLGPWSPTVQAFLAHLRRKGFNGAPLPLGFDAEGREVLEYIPGETLATPQEPDGPVILLPYPEAWRSDDALRAAGELIRSLHEAARGFSTKHAHWRLHDKPMRAGEIMCHADHGPWNTVYREGLPVAFIDWDSARPDEPILDLAQAAWHFVPLVDDADAQAMGLQDIEYGPRLRTFLAAYELDKMKLRSIEALRLAKERESDLPQFWGLGPEDEARFIDGLRQELRWLSEHATELGL